MTGRALPAQHLDYDVVIPTHARSLGLLTEAIDSVRRQTVPPRRIIVAVDANAEGAAKVRAIHPDVQVVLLAKQGGPATARQAGITASTAEWVAFLDDDDLWARDKQASLADYVARHRECRAVRAGYWMCARTDDVAQDGLNGQLVELRGDTVEELEAEAATREPLNDLSYLDIEGDSLTLLLEFNRGVTGTTMVRRDVLQSLPEVPSDQRPGNDHLLFIHVASVTEWHLVRERLAFYRLHPGQETRLPDPARARGALLAKLRGWQAYGHLTTRPLSSFGRTYRVEVRRAIWGLLRRGLPAEAWKTYLFALPLLPSLGDRVLTLIPEPVVWRWHRLTSRAEGTASRPAPPW